MWNIFTAKCLMKQRLPRGERAGVHGGICGVSVVPAPVEGADDGLTKDAASAAAPPSERLLVVLRDSLQVRGLARRCAADWTLQWRTRGSSAGVHGASARCPHGLLCCS